MQDSIVHIMVNPIALAALNDDLAIRRSHSVHLTSFPEIAHAERAIGVDKLMLLALVTLLISSLLNLLWDRSSFEVILSN